MTDEDVSCAEHDAAPAHGLRGPQQPAARRGHRRQARHRAGPDPAQDVRQRRDLRALRRERPRRRRVPRAVAARQAERARRGAAHHDPGGQARLGPPRHRRAAVLPLRPPRQEERRPRAHHRPPHGHAARGRRRRPRAVDGPASGPDAGLLRDPRRPHDGRAHPGRLLPYRGFGDAELVAVSADAGGVKLAKRFANRLDADLAVLTKMRPAHNVAETMHFIGDVDGKIAIVVDDIIDTAGSVDQRDRHAVRARRQRGLRHRDARHLLGPGARAHRAPRRSRRSWSPTPCRSCPT